MRKTNPILERFFFESIFDNFFLIIFLRKMQKISGSNETNSTFSPIYTFTFDTQTCRDHFGETYKYQKNNLSIW